MNHFNLGEQEQIFDEVEFIVREQLAIAVDVHHIRGRGKDMNKIENLIALSRYNHDLAHASKHSKKFLEGIHKQFLENNPY